MNPLRFNHLLYTLMVSLILLPSCSAEVLQAPTDKHIEGPFVLTQEWKTIALETPLKVLPHIHTLELSLGDEYEVVTDIEMDKFYNLTYGYKNSTTQQVIKPEIILVDAHGREFRATMETMGHHKIPAGTYNFLGYGTNSDEGKFFYPKGTEFVAIKARANIEITLHHFYWRATYYYRYPDKDWSNVSASDIVNLD